MNKDGLMDIISGQSALRASGMSSKIYLFENISKRHGRRSLRIYLKGKESNIAGLGAVVRVKTSKGVKKFYTEYQRGGLPSQSEEGLFVGLGEESLEYIEVRWPYMQKNKSMGSVKKYDLKGWTFREDVVVTLCESGRYRRGRRPCE